MTTTTLQSVLVSAETGANYMKAENATIHSNSHVSTSMLQPAATSLDSCNKSACMSTIKRFSETSVDSGDSGRGLGTEMNIGLSSSKDLDNGLKASYGFNLEMDSGSTDSIGDVYYMTIGAGNVSFSIARDHGQNLSSTVVPHISDQAGTVVGSDFDTFGNIGSADAHNYYHVRLDSKIGVELLL